MTTRTFPNGETCHTGPTCHRHQFLWNPAAKMEKAFNASTLETPKPAEVNGFFGSAVVEPKKPATKTARVPKEEYLEQKKAKLDALHTELQEQVANLHNDVEWSNYLDSVTKFHKYSFSNQIIISIQNPNATRVAGFNKWKEMGRNVKRGEKALNILAPKIYNVVKEDKDGNPVKGPDGKPIKERRVVGFTGVSVFDVSQTEGKPLPPKPELSETPPEGLKEDLENAVESYGYSVHYSDDAGPGEGYTSKTDKKVVIKKSLNPGQTASVLAHELGHIAAGHMEREDYHTGEGGHRGTMEVEAESISYVILRANGMSTAAGTESKGYVSGWAKAQKDPDTVKKSAEKVSSTVKKLLDDLTWKNANLDDEAGE